MNLYAESKSLVLLKNSVASGLDKTLFKTEIFRDSETGRIQT